MGGHGGLNILPQKRWNVYNFDNREKVKKDEEEAAKEEQIKREQSRKRDAEFRLQLLRQARGLATPPGPHGSAPPTEPQASASAPPAPAEKEAASVSPPDSEPEPERKSKFNHINLFEGIKIFDLPKEEQKRKGDDEDDRRSKKMKKEAPPRVVLPEDEKYRMGYGVAGKDVKLPWYMSKPSKNDGAEKGDNSDDDYKSREVKGGAKKKTLQELREERLKREKREKERERALLNRGRMVTPELPDRYFHRRGGK